MCIENNTKLGLLLSLHSTFESTAHFPFELLILCLPFDWFPLFFPSVGSPAEVSRDGMLVS